MFLVIVGWNLLPAGEATPGALAVCGVPERYGSGVLYVILRLLSRRWEVASGIRCKSAGVVPLHW